MEVTRYILPLLLALGIPLYLSISIVAWAIKNGIGPMPTSPKQKQGLMSSLPTNLQGKVFDLGSGWGTLAIPLAKKLPECEVIGYESSPVPYFFSRILQFILKYPNLRFYKRDVLQIPLNDASLIICYLHPAAMKKLKPKLENELKKGTTVITNTFVVPGWMPENVVEANDIYRSKIYTYRR
jgi:trans-aconitate methyltransferase